LPFAASRGPLGWPLLTEDIRPFTDGVPFAAVKVDSPEGLLAIG